MRSCVQAEGGSPSKKEKDPWERLWNLPDYVKFKDELLYCTLCSAKAATVVAMYQHLHGERHRKKGYQLEGKQWLETKVFLYRERMWNLWA